MNRTQRFRQCSAKYLKPAFGGFIGGSLIHSCNSNHFLLLSQLPFVPHFLYGVVRSLGDTFPSAHWSHSYCRHSNRLMLRAF